MDLPQILALDIKGRNLAIIGPAASGKTFLSNLIGNGTHLKIHTDSYISAGYEQSMYLAMDETKNVIGNWIAEGCLVYRMLRKGLDPEYVFRPSIIIECERPRYKREKTYIESRDIKKLKYQQSFAAGLTKIYGDFLMQCPKYQRPEIVVWNNSY